VGRKDWARKAEKKVGVLAPLDPCREAGEYGRNRRVSEPLFIPNKQQAFRLE